MIVCPVCEHEQVHGADCDVCGKKLAHGAAAAELARVQPMDGLEPTLHAPTAAPREERVPEVEPTHHAPAGDAPSEAVELEATRVAPVDVEVVPAPDIERTELPGDAPTAVPALVVCRYCRTMATPGERICARCGMRLPVYGAAFPDDETAPVRRCSCGAPVRGGACPSCGARR